MMIGSNAGCGHSSDELSVCTVSGHRTTNRCANRGKAPLSIFEEFDGFCVPDLSGLVGGSHSCCNGSVTLFAAHITHLRHETMTGADDAWSIWQLLSGSVGSRAPHSNRDAVRGLLRVVSFGTAMLSGLLGGVLGAELHLCGVPHGTVMISFAIETRNPRLPANGLHDTR